MSKIIDALDKAKRDGNVEQTVRPVDERDTLNPVAEGSSQNVGRRTRRRSGPHLLSTRALDPTLLEGVDPHVETLHKPMSVISEQYRSLRNRIERANFEGRIKTIAVTSAQKGEGKSITAVNLSLSMAQDATKRILLVDSDLRRPTIHKLLNLEVGAGLADYLEGNASRQEVTRSTPFFGLDIVPSGNTTGHPGELLASPEFAELVDLWRSEYDYVLFDTPPLHPISDVSFLTETVDGVLLVIRFNKTSKSVLRHVKESIPSNKLIGSLLNRTDGLRGGYGSKKGYYYYKYY